jgi:long-chain fatty acid transport protein
MKKTAILALVLPALALANGYDVPNVNPRDLAMVSSGIAAQDDAEAAFANPAALAKLTGLNLSLAGGFLDLETSWKGPAAPSPQAGQSARTKFRPVPPYSLFLAYGFEVAGHKAAIGAGSNIPGGGNVFWHDDWPGRGRIITVDRKIYGFYLTGGYEVIPDLRIGGGLVYYYGTEYLKQGIQPFPDAFGELATKGGALSFDLSAEYKLPAVPLTLGADFKYKGTLKLSGNGHFVVPEGLLPGSQPPPVDQGVKHTLIYPSVLNVGAAYRVAAPLLLAAAYTWNGYSVYHSDVFKGDQGTTIEVPRHYKNGYTIRLGGEYDLDPRLKLRVGLERDISGLNTDFYSATLPDSSTWAAGLGAAWRLSPDLSLAASFFYAWLDKVTVTGTSEFPGSYITRVWIASAGITFRTDLGGGR